MSAGTFERVTHLTDLPLNGPHRLDSYMVWDRLTGQARHLDGQPDAPLRDHWPVMVEFTSSDAAAALDGWLRSISDRAAAALLERRFTASVRLATGSRIHTAILPRDDHSEALLLAAVRDGHLERFVVGAPCQHADPVPRQGRQAPRRNQRGKSWPHALGIIDDGCCFAHAAFRAAGSCRVHALWDQTPGASPDEAWHALRPGPGGALYGYGVEMLRRDLTKQLTANPGLGEDAEREVYKSIGRPAWGPPSHAHGAAVMHLLAGDLPTDPAQGSRKARTMPIVFVQVPHQTILDVTGDSLGMHVVDGARYIAERARALAGDGNPWSATINISLGAICGPHDGTSMAEQALADLVSGSPVHIVTAAGNAAGEAARTHDRQTVSASRPGLFVLRSPPGRSRDGFVELWFDTRNVEIDSFSVRVAPPGMPLDQAPRWRVGNAAALGTGAASPCAALVFARRVAQGMNDSMALLSIAATTQRPGGSRALSAPGQWTVEVSSDSATAADVHAWIERDDEVVGTRRGQQLRFERLDAAAGDDDGVAGNVTMSSLANAAALMAVGSVIESSGAIARYSGNGPLRRAGGETDARPALYATADRSPWLPGIPVAGFFSGTRTTMRGTSAAAPQVARLVAEDRLPAAEPRPGTPRPLPPHPRKDSRWRTPPPGAFVVPRPRHGFDQDSGTSASDAPPHRARRPASKPGSDRQA